jgi:hypothetical protein
VPALAIRVKCNLRWRVVKNLGPGDDLVELETGHHARSANPSLPKRWEVRAVSYQRRGFPPQVLLTSLTDPDRYPACELADLYHERREIELGYDEVKTDMLDRQEAIRSRKPSGVAQELWGVALAYNLVRLEMVRIAEEAKVPPNRISFTMALRLMRRVALVRRCQARGDPEASPGLASRRAAPRPRTQATTTELSARREGQDEQLRPQAADR